MVDGADAPQSGRTLWLQMIEAGEGTVLHQETQRRLRLEPERHQQRHLDGPAMGDGNDIAPAVLNGEALNHGPHAMDEIDEAFSARWALVGRPEPQRMRANHALGVEGLALHALPHAQVLFGQLPDADRPNV